LKYLYLVQGEAKLVSDYLHLSERLKAEAIFLTYDKKLERALHKPHTTWAEGRNILLEHALQKPKFDYYIFLDDDIRIIKGSWDIFEEELEKHKPAIAVPIVPKTRFTPIQENGEIWDLQALKIHDEQFMAIHYDVIEDNIITPYVTEFDDLSWWAACEIQQILIHTIYNRYSIQFNKIEIENLIHGRHDTKDHSYKEKVRSWISRQLLIPYTDIWYYWEDWPGQDKSFIIEELFHDKIQHKRQYEDSFKNIIETTRLFLQQSKNKKSVSYKLNTYYINRILNPKENIYERISR